jgi:hypothetical protein
LKEWHRKLKERPTVQAGLDVPEKNKYKDSSDPKEQERIAKEASAWIMQGTHADKKK